VNQRQGHCHDLPEDVRNPHGGKCLVNRREDDVDRIGADGRSVAPEKLSAWSFPEGRRELNDLAHDSVTKAPL